MLKRKLGLSKVIRAFYYEPLTATGTCTRLFLIARFKAAIGKAFPSY
jgi:hypothetical protein